jgi:hypothetical protein
MGMYTIAIRNLRGPHGITHLVLPPVEFLERYAALIPPPYFHMTRYYGIFSSNASRRMEICPQRIKVGHAFKRVVKGAPPPRGPTDSTAAAQKQTEEGRSYRLKLHPCAGMPKEGRPEETKESAGDPFGAKREGCTSPYPQRKNGRIPFGPNWLSLPFCKMSSSVLSVAVRYPLLRPFFACRWRSSPKFCFTLTHLGLPVDTSDSRFALFPSRE